MKNYDFTIWCRSFLLNIILFFGANLYSQADLSHFQKEIDSLMFNAIDSMAFPGAQLLIIYKNNTLVNKSFGYHTYDKVYPVQNHHLYDLASVTKTMAGGLALMKLQDQHLFYPDMPLKMTHPYFKNSDKAEITWREIMAHQSGMVPYIVFWQTAKRKNGKYKWRTFKDHSSTKYNIQIDENTFLHQRYPHRMMKLIKKSELKPEKKYLYSGLGFLLIPEMVKEKTNHTLDQYLKKEYFDPMGLDRISFNPSEKYDQSEIVPTEIDTFFRHKLVRGFVHDENASMLNGVSANAGLFANASDLGEIAKMLLDKGVYKGQKVITSYIVEEYTSVQYPENENRRGLTFDKPSLEYNPQNSYVGKSASPSSFGHSGFTGTFYWVDPEYDLIIVLLTNRVYPYRSQRKLYTMNFRPELHESVYQFIKSLEKHTE